MDLITPDYGLVIWSIVQILIAIAILYVLYKVVRKYLNTK